MGTKGVSSVDHELKVKTLQQSLVKECRVMLDYCLANGKTVNARMVLPLERKDEDIDSKELLPVYNYLANLVKPVSPGTLVLFEVNRQSKSRFKFLGPLPIVRSFMLLTITSLLALIAFSLSPDVNAGSIQLSMLQGMGWDQALRLAFLLSCASVGGSFYALFKMNSYISKGTFDMKYSATYWSRYVLGLVAGVLLSELFVAFIEPGVALGDASSLESLNAKGLSEHTPLDSAGYLLKPILAILGGFSASLVYRILNRLIEAVESLFKGSSEQIMDQQAQQLTSHHEEQENMLRSHTAGQLIALKSDLLNKGVDPDALKNIDELMQGLVPVAPDSVEPLVKETQPAEDVVSDEPAEEAGDEPAPEPAREPEIEAPEKEAPEPGDDDKPSEDTKPGTTSW